MNVLRPITERDLDAILRVQAACYPPAMQESGPVVLSRIHAAGATSLVAERDGRVCGYLFAYRSAAGAVSPLDAPFKVVPDGDTLYLHDLSVAPEAAGLGLARRMVERLHRQAREAGLADCALVSVQDTRTFWEKMGYAASACAGEEAGRALASYPAVAVYMTRRVWPGDAA